MPDVMERDNDHPQRKMKKAVKETPNFTLAVEISEELRPDMRLENMRYAGNKEADEG
jgi:hypothetical protein